MALPADVRAALEAWYRSSGLQDLQRMIDLHEKMIVATCHPYDQDWLRPEIGDYYYNPLADMDYCWTKEWGTGVTVTYWRAMPMTPEFKGEHPVLRYYRELYTNTLQP